MDAAARPAHCVSPRRAHPAQAKAGFASSGPFTEALLAGNLATRLQMSIERDAAARRAKNAPEADAFIRKQYRKGFGLT